MTAGIAFIDVEGEPVKEEKESLVYTAAQEAIGLAMSVMEVVARLGRLAGNMMGLLGEETARG